MLFACEGPQSPQGEEGNANVVSDSVTITDSDWQRGWYDFRTSPTSTLSREALVDTLEVSALTQSIYNSGMALVYFKILMIDGSNCHLGCWLFQVNTIITLGTVMM